MFDASEVLRLAYEESDDKYEEDDCEHRSKDRNDGDLGDTIWMGFLKRRESFVHLDAHCRYEGQDRQILEDEPHLDERIEVSLGLLH